ncbi:hypothetical protein ACAG25_21060 [Mycobacterium sp. pV006]|uniref:hypothetical protein n=1 Tax=Mycobacterium sp. pV006 TaxID=3238983 RepID=UPI00351BA4D0
MAIGPVVFIVSMGVAVAMVRAGRMPPRTTADATGFWVAPDRRFTITVFIGIVAFIPSGVLFTFLVPLGWIDLPLNAGMRIFGSIAFGMVTFIGIAGLIVAGRRGEAGHVKLTPAMVENTDILSTRLFEWDDIDDVADHATTRKAHRAVVLRLRDGREEIISMADVYLPGGAALYWLVRHYWRHPEDRAELADGRVAQRLREGRFDLE